MAYDPYRRTLAQIIAETLATVRRCQESPHEHLRGHWLPIWRETLRNAVAASRVDRARWITVYNSREFYTGACESRSLHIPGTVTAASRRRIARLCGIRC